MPRVPSKKASPKRRAGAKPKTLRALRRAHAPLPIRGKILSEASKATLGDRNATYGDPFPQFQTAAMLKAVFWDAFYRTKSEEEEVRLGRNTPHGEAIDLILTKLSRLANNPSDEPHRDHYVDIAAYAAIAMEVAELTDGVINGPVS